MFSQGTFEGVRCFQVFLFDSGKRPSWKQPFFPRQPGALEHQGHLFGAQVLYVREERTQRDVSIDSKVSGTQIGDEDSTPSESCLSSSSLKHQDSPKERKRPFPSYSLPPSGVVGDPEDGPWEGVVPFFPFSRLVFRRGLCCPFLVSTPL